MRGRIGLLFLLGLSSAAVPLVTADAGPLAGQCRVAHGGKLAASVGADAICAEVERAISAEAPTVRYDAEITVLSPSRLAARLVVEGRLLPVQNFAVMDANLHEDSIRRFARSLAGVVAQAGKQ